MKKKTNNKTLVLKETQTGFDQNPYIFKYLKDAEHEKILSLGKSKDYKANDYLFFQGDVHDGVYVIKSGQIKSFYISATGREITLGYWAAGHFIGAPEIFQGGEHMWSSIAIEPSTVLWYSGKQLNSLLQKMPNLALGLIDGLVYKGKCYTALLQIIGTYPMASRLAQLLLTLIEQQANGDDSHIILRSRFTHDELAGIVGSTRQWISICIKRFEVEGLIKRVGKEIEIIDIKGLKNITLMD